MTVGLHGVAQSEFNEVLSNAHAKFSLSLPLLNRVISIIKTQLIEICWILFERFCRFKIEMIRFYIRICKLIPKITKIFRIYKHNLTFSLPFTNECGELGRLGSLNLNKIIGVESLLKPRVASSCSHK